MKKYILSALIALCSLTSFSAIDGVITLAWDYPAAEISSVTFTIYKADSIPVVGPPNWQPFASVVGRTSLTTTVVPGPNFFICTAKNFWGEGDPSNVASTPALPRSDINLGIRKGQ